MPEFSALPHVAVTVTDLDRSREWYSCLFNSTLPRRGRGRLVPRSVRSG